MTGCICHQSSHTSKLFDLLIRSSRTGVSHHEDVVIFVKSCQQVVSQLIIGCLPGLDNFFVTLFLCDKTTAVVLCDMVNRCLRVSDQLRLACRYGHIGNRYGHGCTCRELVANRLDIIQGDRCLGCTMDIDNLLPESALTASCLRGSQLPVSARSLSGNALSTKPRSCGMISLKMKRPTVDSMIPVFVVPSAIVRVTLTLTLECRVTTLFSYARIASLMLLNAMPSPLAPGRSWVR